MMDIIKLPQQSDVIWTPDSAQIRTEQAAVTLSGRSARGILQVLHPLLHRGASMNDLFSALPQYSPSTVREFVQNLLDIGILHSVKAYHQSAISVLGDSQLATLVQQKLRSSSSSTLIKMSQRTLSSIDTSHGIFAAIMESLGVHSQQQVFEQVTPGLIFLYGFRIDNFYYLMSSSSDAKLAPTEAFERVLRASYVPEDAVYGWSVLHSKKGASGSYFSQSQAHWVAEIVAYNVDLLTSDLDRQINIQLDVRDGLIRNMPYVRAIARYTPSAGISTTSYHDYLQTVHVNLVGEGSIITSVVEVKFRETGGYKPTMRLMRAHYSWPRLGPDLRRNRFWASGSDEDPDLAELKAVAEGVERFCNGFYQLDKLVYESMQGLGSTALDPLLVAGYHPSQYDDPYFPLAPFSRRKKYHWKEAVSLISGENKYLLLDCVYFPISRYELGRHLCVFASSSGTAAHSTVSKATSAALYELCERDALMIVWYHRLRMPLIDVGTLPSRLQKRIERIELTRRRVHIVDCTLDTVPVFIACLTNDEDAPAFICGAGASDEPHLAVEKALNEAEMILASVTQGTGLTIPSHPNQIRIPDHHCAFYFPKERMHLTDFLYSSSSTHSLPSNMMDTVENRIKAIGLDIYRVDLTVDEVQERGVEMYVEKLFVPGLVPISFGYHTEPLGNQRFRELPSKLGLGPPRQVDEMSLDFPHPLP